MRSLARLLAAGLAGLMLPLGLAAPAHAGSVDLQAVSIAWDDAALQLVDGCKRVPFQYSNNSGRRIRGVYFYITRPDGSSHATNALIPAEAGVTGSWEVLFCGSNPPGTYSARLKLLEFDGSSTETTTPMEVRGIPLPANPPTDKLVATGDYSPLGGNASATMNIQGPARQKRGSARTYAVKISSPTATGDLTVVYQKGSRKKVLAVPLEFGAADWKWTPPKSWPTGTTVVYATYIPDVGLPFSGAQVARRISIS